MTLITRLSTAFTDTTLPILRKDPVLPAAGARILLDFKNAGTWDQSDATIGKTDPIYSLVDNGAPTGLDPGLVYQNNTLVDGATHTATMNYDPTTGRVTFPAGDAAAGAVESARYLEKNGQFYIIDDLTAGYCFSMWLYVDGNGAACTLLNDMRDGNDNARRGFQVTYRSDQKRITVSKPSRIGFPIDATTTASSRNDNSFVSPGNLTSGIYRVGYAWYKDGATWKFRGIWDEAIGTETDMLGFDTTGYDAGQSTHDGARDPNRNWGIGKKFSSVPTLFGSPHGIYRLYVENLSVSGRTPEQVWDADWARGNGRFS